MIQKARFQTTILSTTECLDCVTWFWFQRSHENLISQLNTRLSVPSADVSRVLVFFNAHLDSKKTLKYTTCLEKLQTVSSFVFCCPSGLSF